MASGDQIAELRTYNSEKDEFYPKGTGKLVKAIDSAAKGVENAGLNHPAQSVRLEVVSFGQRLRTEATRQALDEGTVAGFRMNVPNHLVGIIIERALTGNNDNLGGHTEVFVDTHIPGIYFRSQKTTIGPLREVLGVAHLPEPKVKP